MNQNYLQRKIQTIHGVLDRTKLTVSTLNTIDAGIFPNEYLKLCTEAALLSERATCLLRNHIYAIGGRRTEYLQKAAAVQGIKILYSDGIFTIEFPFLPGKKHGVHSAQYLFDPLHAALENFTREMAMPKFTECTICIEHIYDAGLFDHVFFDYDNLQNKQLLDTIAAYLLTDDNATLCDLYQTSFRSDRNCTRVYLMAKDQFVRWFLEREKYKSRC